MWCPQTRKEMTAMATEDSAMARYPKMCLRLWTVMSSDTMPKPGSTMMYTAGWL